MIKYLFSAAYKYGYDLNMGVAKGIVSHQNARECNNISGISQRMDVTQKHLK